MKPWITHSIKSYIQSRQNLYKLYKINRLTRTEYNRYRNFVSNEFRKAKEKYYHNLFISIKNDIRKTWSVINEALTPCRNHKQKLFKSFIFNDSLYDQDHEISNLLDEHYSSIGEKLLIHFLHETLCILDKV